MDDIENYLTRYTDRDEDDREDVCSGCGLRDCECDDGPDDDCLGCGQCEACVDRSIAAAEDRGEPPIDLATVTDRFKRAIYLAGLTGGQFARLSGIPFSRVRAIREGGAPSEREVCVCADVCGIAARWIAGEVPAYADPEKLPEPLRTQVKRVTNRETYWGLLESLAATGR